MSDNLSGCANSWISAASNIVPSGGNPSYDKTAFLAFYPQFTGLTPDPIPDVVLTQFIALANATVLQARWHEAWPLGMANFIAHFATLFLEASAGTSPAADDVIAAAQTRGLITSESAGDVSASYDVAGMTTGLDGWAQFKATTYGVQFATMARMMGRAGSYIY